MPLALTRIVAAIALAAIASIASAAGGFAAESEACRQATEMLEQREQIPMQLLHAVALAESGRWDGVRKASFAWPWTITADGAGKFYESKEAAIAEVRRLRAKGVRNIDVGCMQINLYHHANAFPSLEQAFDPAINAAYAARFLRELRDEHHSWSGAIARYHSSDRDRGQAYSQRVLTLWNTDRRRAFREAREARIQNYLRARAAQPANAQLTRASRPGEFRGTQYASRETPDLTRPGAAHFLNGRSR